MSERIIVITGAGAGLAYQIAKQHLTAKDRVFGLEAFQMEGIKSLEEQYPKMQGFRCDITSEEDVMAAATEIKEQIGDRIDIIYNVAGIFTEAGRVGIGETELPMCKQMMDVNAFGMIRVCKAFDSHIKEGAVVLNVSSEAGSIGAARRNNEYAYCMSKAAMNMGAKILSNELWSRNARVMCIEPGWMKTNMGGEAALASPRAVWPEETARDIIGIVNGINEIPRDQMFMTQKGDILPW